MCFSHLQVLPEALLIWTYLLPPKPPPIRFSRHIVHTRMNMLWRVGARLPAPPTSTLEGSSEWLPLLRSHITTPFPPPAHSRLPSAVRSTHSSLPLDGNISRAGIQPCSYPSPFYALVLNDSVVFCFWAHGRDTHPCSLAVR